MARNRPESSTFDGGRTRASQGKAIARSSAREKESFDGQPNFHARASRIPRSVGLSYHATNPFSSTDRIKSHGRNVCQFRPFAFRRPPVPADLVCYRGRRPRFFGLSSPSASRRSLVRADRFTGASGCRAAVTASKNSAIARRGTNDRPPMKTRRKRTPLTPRVAHRQSVDACGLLGSSAAASGNVSKSSSARAATVIFLIPRH